MMRSHTLPFVFALVASSTLALTAANAQSMDEALELYEDRDYDEAAFAFFDVLQHDASAEVRDQAEIYLADSLRKQGFYFPALFYYSDIFKAGRSTRYYLKAVEGLLEIQRELHDPLFVPTLVNAKFDPEGFGQLDPDKIAQINYLIGELSARKRKDDDARAFLQYVAASSPLYPKARYLLGVLDIRARNTQGALEHFKAVLDTVDPDTPSEEQRRVRNLAVLAVGRAFYGGGQYGEATRYFEKVPRFSEQWFDALYENAWAYFRAGDYGSALGELQSVTSPYFSKHHIPEAYVIQGTAYFANCQWDRVRAAVAIYKSLYGDMLTGLEVYLKTNREPGEYYRDVVATGNGHFAAELARRVRRTTRFKDYHFMLEHLKWERQQLDEVSVWKRSRLADDLASVIDQHREELLGVVGRWVNIQLRNLHAHLKHFGSQIDILDFEVADAERQWLEQGKEILKGRRARLPRPDIPNDQWQHWKFAREYWKDELGYYRHTLRSECE